MWLLLALETALLSTAPINKAALGRVQTRVPQAVGGDGR